MVGVPSSTIVILVADSETYSHSYLGNLVNNKLLGRPLYDSRASYILWKHQRMVFGAEIPSELIVDEDGYWSRSKFWELCHSDTKYGAHYRRLLKATKQYLKEACTQFPLETKKTSWVIEVSLPSWWPKKKG